VQRPDVQGGPGDRAPQKGQGSNPRAARRRPAGHVQDCLEDQKAHRGEVQLEKVGFHGQLGLHEQCHQCRPGAEVLHQEAVGQLGGLEVVA